MECLLSGKSHALGGFSGAFETFTEGFHELLGVREHLFTDIHLSKNRDCGGLLPRITIISCLTSLVKLCVLFFMFWWLKITLEKQD